MEEREYQDLVLWFKSEGQAKRHYPQTIEDEPQSVVQKSKKANWHTHCKLFALREDILVRHLPVQEEVVIPDTGKVERKKVMWDVIVILKGEEQAILEKFHSSYHLGRNAMHKMITQEYWWPEGMMAAIMEFRKRCDTCERRTKSTWKAPLRPIVASRPNELWQIDFTGPYEYDVEKGEEIIHKKVMCLLGLDSYSKYKFGDIFATKKCRRVAEFLDEKIRDEGHPNRVQSDNGGEFIGPEVKALYTRHGIKGYVLPEFILKII